MIEGTINILGVNYTICKSEENEDKTLINCDGYCDYTTHLIVIKKMEYENGSVQDLEYYEGKVLRHEIIHAFLFESGLGENSDWARNEEMVDFFAFQLPKIIDSYLHIVWKNKT